MGNKSKVRKLLILFFLSVPFLYSTKVQAAEDLIDNNLDIKTDRLEKGQEETKTNTGKNNEALFVPENQEKLKLAKSKALAAEELAKTTLFTKAAVHVEAYDSKILFKAENVATVSQSSSIQEESTLIGDFLPLVGTVSLIFMGIWISAVVYKKGALGDGE